MRNTECTEAMYQAFKECLRNTLDSETVEDSYKNAIEAALQVKAEADLEVLGFRRNGLPIKECRPDRVYTAAVVVCSSCLKVIRGMGGPIPGALCFDCSEAQSV